MGSVFSPHYAAARAKKPTDPREHLAINVALYGQHRAWVFTEAAAGPYAIAPDTLRVGGNTWRTTADGIELTLNDRTTPWGRPVRGHIRLTGAAQSPTQQSELDGAGRHVWWPYRPVARVEVALTEPSVQWQGDAYHDQNWGHEPLAAGFRRWSWMRITEGARTVVHYTGVGTNTRRHTEPWTLSRRFDADGHAATEPTPTMAAMPRSGWGLRGEVSHPIERLRRCEDTPFYQRAWLTLRGQDGNLVTAMHETLDLGRFAMRWVQRLLPFRLRRLP